jgi:hypothetical protein
MIRFQCPNCHATMSAGDGAAGKQGVCHHCQRPVVVPLRSTLPEPFPGPRSGGPSLWHLGLLIVLPLLILALGGKCNHSEVSQVQALGGQE